MSRPGIVVAWHRVRNRQQRHQLAGSRKEDIVQGIYLEGSRPASKAAIKRFVAGGGDLADINIEATSVFGNEFDGPLSEAPLGTINFVGPDPYTKRNYYGTITVLPDGTVKVS